MHSDLDAPRAISGESSTPPIHPIQRAQERYGLTLSLVELSALESKILRGESMCLHKTSSTELVVVAHTVSTTGLTVPLVAIFSRAIKKIKTFLPEATAYDMNLRKRLFIEEERDNRNANLWARPRSKSRHREKTPYQRERGSLDDLDMAGD